MAMDTFEEKMDELSNVFTGALKEFNEVTTSPILGILAGQVCLAEEFRKASLNIKVAC
jgi:hypothetical protein